MISGEDEAIAFLEPTSLKGEEDILEVLEVINIGVAGDDCGFSGNVLIGEPGLDDVSLARLTDASSSE